MSKYYISLSFLWLFSAACTHKELCYDHLHAANLLFEVKWNLQWHLKWTTDWDKEIDDSWAVDWAKVIPKIPEGIRVVAYPRAANGNRQVHNLPAGGGPVELVVGEYDCLLYNNDTEYIVFEGNALSHTVVATTRSRSRSPYTEEHPGEVTVNPPDVLFCAYEQGVKIKEMTSSEFEGEVIRDTLHAELSPLVYTYILRFEFAKGKAYISAARGSLSGMAGSVLLYNGKTLDDVVTLLFEDHRIRDYGVEVYLRSFGTCSVLPDSSVLTSKAVLSRARRPKVTSETRNLLTLELLLKNGKTKTIATDVTEQLRAHPRGGVIVVKGLEVTPAEGNGGGSGMEVEVNDWGDHKQVDIPMQNNKK